MPKVSTHQIHSHTSQTASPLSSIETQQEKIKADNHNNSQTKKHNFLYNIPRLYRQQKNQHTDRTKSNKQQQQKKQIYYRSILPPFEQQTNKQKEEENQDRTTSPGSTMASKFEQQRGQLCRTI